MIIKAHEKVIRQLYLKLKNETARKWDTYKNFTLPSVNTPDAVSQLTVMKMLNLRLRNKLTNKLLANPT